MNIEKERQGIKVTDSTVWRGNFIFGFDLTRQQNTILQFDNDDYLLLMTPKHAYIWIGHINLIKSEGENVISEGYFHHRINFWRKRKLSAEVFAQYQYNETRGLLNRGLVGITPRLSLKKSESLDINVGTGIMYEWEEWKLDESFTLTYFLKSTNYINFHAKFNKNTELMFITYYQALFDRFFHPRIIGDANFRAKLSKHVSFNMKFVPYYDAQPVISIEKWNYEITSGIGIQF
ncbi:DUF481 domain-containing protein [Bernardetia litoralis]|uniref:DUF481 domain-containing protein n=1 Tax=Bernardetia litoralis TaxID=999 RepID=UPI0012FE404B|nr:DUF481 domain-containing protein [Bernardetia litoralis]